MKSLFGSAKRRWLVLGTAILAAAAVTVFVVDADLWGIGDDAAVGTTDDAAAAAEPISFSEEPLWTTPGEAWEGNPDGISVGLEHFNDVRLVGDFLVLVGFDDDGELNDLGFDAGTIVVVDTRTGDLIWTAYNGMPLPEDDQKSLYGFGDNWDIEIVEDGASAAIVVAYESRVNDSDFELGVVGLAVGSGELLWSIPADVSSDFGRDLSIKSVTDENLLVDIHGETDDEKTVEAVLLNIDTAESVWSHENYFGVGISDDAVVLVEMELSGSSVGAAPFVLAVDRVSGEPIWDSGGEPEEETYFVSAGAGLVAANTDGASILDITTGEQLDSLDSEWFQSCVTDSETMIGCKVANRGLATITVSEDSLQITEVPDTDELDPVAVASGWVFTSEEVLPKDTYLAVDSAGNTMETPGQLADIDEELAVFYTGDVYNESAWGTQGAAIEVYTIEG